MQAYGRNRGRGSAPAERVRAAQPLVLRDRLSAAQANVPIQTASAAAANAITHLPAVALPTAIPANASVISENSTASGTRRW